jgi:hypothetical protein
MYNEHSSAKITGPSQSSEINLAVMTSSNDPSRPSPMKVGEIAPSSYQIKSDADFRRDHASSQQPLNPDLAMVGHGSFSLPQRH